MTRNDRGAVAPVIRLPKGGFTVPKTRYHDGPQNVRSTRVPRDVRDSLDLAVYDWLASVGRDTVALDRGSFLRAAEEAWERVAG